MSKSWTDRVSPIQLAWLLREDLRGGQDASAPISDSFRLWWTIVGRAEYPAWASHDTVDVAALLRPLPDWPSYGAFGVCPALRYLCENREDLKALFDTNTDAGIWHALAWFYIHGLREYHLMDAIDAQLRRELDATPPFFALENSSTPSPTWLMFFAWRSSPELQERFDLRDGNEQTAFLNWFLCEGIAALGLSPLIAERWREWMRVPLRVLPTAQIPRAGLLMWQRRADLRAAFPATQPDSLASLAAWTANAYEIEPALQWVQKKSATKVLVPGPDSARPFGVNLIGFARGELGIGEDVRMAAAACEAVGIPFSIVNIDPGTNLRQADDFLASHLNDVTRERAPYAFNVFCLTGFDTARVALEEGPELFEGRINIGWWPWELPVWPKTWVAAFSVVDEIWAATQFTEVMYKTAIQAIDTPSVRVIHMPLAAEVSRCKLISRASLGLPEDRFLFLYVFDFNSYLARKNPLAAVQAFKHAFSTADRAVGLVLKTMNANEANLEWEAFLDECATDERIVVLDKTLERGEVLGLIQQCDAYVSLHRSEGFGRTLAEAMLFGKPVVATDFSGNRDFLNATNGFPVAWTKRPVQSGEYAFVTESDHAWWAEPIVEQASSQLSIARLAAQNSNFRKTINHFAEKQFSVHRIGKLIQNRLYTIEQF